MRFYLNLPLIAGYVLMATTACLGMLQLAAARGNYRGLSLFVSNQKQGKRIGAGLTAGAVLAYVLLAPEILTPGPAGTEVAGMFTVCALIALAVTLVGADLRLRRSGNRDSGGGEPILLGDLSATLHRPSQLPEASSKVPLKPMPVVVVVPDPTGFVIEPAALKQDFLQAGIAVLALNGKHIGERKAPLSRQTVVGHISMALLELSKETAINRDQVGLIGLGLGGDAVLHAAAKDGRIKAAVAVSPFAQAPLMTQSTDPSIEWLHELSYRLAWRWRRKRRTFKSSTARFDVTDTPETMLLTTQSLYGDLKVPDPGFFALLENEQARQMAVRWLQEKLGHGN